MPKEGDMEVWWIPQVPMKPFTVPIKGEAVGKLLLDVLANYDAFQFENNVKSDYCNAGGIRVFQDGDWYDLEPPD